jgi:hypothetical protein
VALWLKLWSLFILWLSFILYFLLWRTQIVISNFLSFSNFPSFFYCLYSIFCPILFKLFYSLISLQRCIDVLVQRIVQKICVHLVIIPSVRILLVNVIRSFLPHSSSHNSIVSSKPKKEDTTLLDYFMSLHLFILLAPIKEYYLWYILYFVS